MWKGDACLEEADEAHFSSCLDFAKANGASIIGPSFKGEQNNYYHLLEPWMVEMARNKGFAIHPYTFATENDIAKYMDKCDGMFTDRTDLVYNQLNGGELNVKKAFKAINF